MLKYLSLTGGIVFKTIGIVGGGVVGHATARSYMEFAEVRVYDIVPEKRTHSLDAVLECDIIFVCLPSPQREGSTECDTSYIEAFFNCLRQYPYPDRERNYVLKSTVPIGTTKRLSRDYNLKDLVHSPEFLTARCAVTDAQIPARNIIGIPDGTQQSQCRALLKELYVARFPGVSVITLMSDESEAVKVIQNAFFAVKVGFFNEAEELVTKLGGDWKRVREAILADGRIAHSHTQVPGPDGKYGFGGACLVKDLANFCSMMVENGLIPAASAGALMRNKADRKRGDK